MTRELAIGVIGLGNAGSRHARALERGEVPGARLAAVCDTDFARAAQFPSALQGSFEALVRRPDLHAWVIATPHPSHTVLCSEALRHGRSVLVEKPFGVHKAECQRALELQAAGCAIGVVHDYRVEPKYIWLKKLLSERALGEPVRFNWQATDFFRTEAYFSNSSWRGRYASEGGGVLVNQAPHLLDSIVWLFGMPRRVWASCGFGRFHAVEVEDDVTAVLEFDSGLRGVLQISTGESPGTQRLDVSCDAGRVVIEGGDASVHYNAEACSAYSRRAIDGRPGAKRESLVLPPHGASGLGVLRNFVAALRGEEPLACPAVEALSEVELANAILWSAIEQRPVELPMDADGFERLLQSLKSGERR